MKLKQIGNTFLPFLFALSWETSRVQAQSINLLVNPGAENGLDGWTATSTAIFPVGYLNCLHCFSDIRPENGAYYFGATAPGSLTQIVPLVGTNGITAAQVDDGTLRVTTSFWEQGLRENLQVGARIDLSFLDATTNLLGSVSTPEVKSAINYAWTNGTSDFAIPVGTRTILASIIFLTKVDVSPSVFVDDVFLSAATVPAPNLIAEPSDAAVGLGSNVALGVAALGAPPLVYQWQLNGTNLQDGVRISGSGTTNLTIHDFHHEDSGPYQVIVSNNSGTVTTKPAILTVDPHLAEPLIEVQPGSEIVAWGSKAVFSVTAFGAPPTQYQWFLNGLKLEDSARVIGTRSSSLAINGMRSGDSGAYQVVVSNPYNSATSSPALLRGTDKSAPPPTNSTATAVWARSGGGPTRLLQDPNYGLGNTDEFDAVAADGRGGVYVTGGFTTYAKYGTLEMASTEPARSFLVVKYDAEGTPIWEHHASAGRYYSGGKSTLPTADGGVVIAGECTFPVTIDGVAEAPRYSGDAGGFIVKYSAAGKQEWIRFIKGRIGTLRLAADSFGNIFIASSAFDAADFGDYVFNSTPVGSLSQTVIFATMYDAAGDRRWIKQTGIASSGGMGISGFDVDAEGNLYLSVEASSGCTTCASTLDFGAKQVVISGYARVNYIVKFDSAANALWATQVDIADGNCDENQVRVDGEGNSYVGSPSCNDLAPNLISKLDPYGHLLWENRIPGARMNYTIDALGGITAVSVMTPDDFAALSGQTVNLPDVLALLRLDSSGNLLGAHSFGSYETGPFISCVSGDSPTSWFVAGLLDAYSIVDGIRQQSPWPQSQDNQGFVARVEFPEAKAPPVITVQPQITPRYQVDPSSPIVFESMPVHLQVVASSIPELKYQWQFNGLNILNATTDTLEFDHASVDLAGSYSVALMNPNGSTASTNVLLTVLPLSELGRALNATNVTWSMGGAASWELDTTIAHDGLISARTPYLDLANPAETTWIETSVVGPGVASFWWKASSATNSEQFVFLVDGVAQKNISGAVDWLPFSLPIQAGTHTLRWQLTLHGLWDNENRCWLDEVSFATPSSGGAPVISNATIQPNGDFEFTVTGKPGATFAVEATSDFKNWLPVAQLAATNGTALFIRPVSPNFPNHFFRAVLITP